MSLVCHALNVKEQVAVVSVICPSSQLLSLATITISDVLNLSSLTYFCKNRISGLQGRGICSCLLPKHPMTDVGSAYCYSSRQTELCTPS